MADDESRTTRVFCRSRVVHSPLTDAPAVKTDGDIKPSIEQTTTPMQHILANKPTTDSNNNFQHRRQLATVGNVAVSRIIDRKLMNSSTNVNLPLPQPQQRLQSPCKAINSTINVKIPVSQTQQRLQSPCKVINSTINVKLPVSQTQQHFRSSRKPFNQLLNSEGKLSTQTTTTSSHKRDASFDGKYCNRTSVLHGSGKL